jgi:hypothetical protein
MQHYPNLLELQLMLSTMELQLSCHQSREPADGIDRTGRKGQLIHLLQPIGPAGGNEPLQPPIPSNAIADGPIDCAACFRDLLQH